MHGYQKKFGVLGNLSKEFFASVWERLVQLIIASIVVGGRRSIWRLRFCSNIQMIGHISTYHRVFCHRRWSTFEVALRLAEFIV